MNNSQNDYFRSDDFKNDVPAHANRLAVNFCFSRNFFALPKCQGILFNPVNNPEDFIPDTYGI